MARLLTVTAPEWGDELEPGASTAYQYDEAGNLTKRTDPRGVVTDLRCDVRSRIRTKTYTGGVATSAVTYCYDGQTSASGCGSAPTGGNLIGRLTQVSNAESAMRYKVYDDPGRITQSELFLSTPINSRVNLPAKKKKDYEVDINIRYDAPE